MSYGFRPLYPPPNECGARENCVRMPLFHCEPYSSSREPCGCPQTVRLENPCCPEERVSVSLSVDNCGNLVICVHREPPRCDCRPRPRRGCC